MRSAHLPPFGLVDYFSKNCLFSIKILFLWVDSQPQQKRSTLKIQTHQI